MYKAIFLDRDGVINVKPREHDYVKNFSEFTLLPTVPKSLKILKDAGFLLLVISNQRGISRGLFTEKNLESIHTALNSLLRNYYDCPEVDAFYFCPHDYAENCYCRKPKPGMIYQAQKDWNIDLKKSYFIGDSLTDVECGRAVDVKTFLMASNSDLYPIALQILDYIV